MTARLQKSARKCSTQFSMRWSEAALAVALVGCSSPGERVVYVYVEAGPATVDSGVLTTPDADMRDVNDSSVDAPDAADAGTGSFFDPCDPLQSLKCQPQYTCWQTHTPGARVDGYQRCIFYCSGPTDPRCAQTLDGACESPVPGSGSLVCVPVH
jgi:hypothetical protein